MEFTTTTTPAAAAAPQYVIFPQEDLVEVEITAAGDGSALVKALVVGTGIAIVAAWCSKPGKSLRNRVANAIKAD
jgi:hypothetical protein